MTTLSQFGGVLLLLGATFGYYAGLGWLKHARWEATREDPRHLRLDARREGDGGRDIRREREADCRPCCPDEDWCPAHDTWFGPEIECPGCREEWEQTWTLGEDPEEIARRDDWNDSRERAEIEAYVIGREEEAGGDSWYADLVRRVETGQDPHDPYRD